MNEPDVFTVEVWDNYDPDHAHWICVLASSSAADAVDVAEKRAKHSGARVLIEGWSKGSVVTSLEIEWASPYKHNAEQRRRNGEFVSVGVSRSL